MNTDQGCPKALGTGECDCASGRWITGLLARLAAAQSTQTDAVTS